MRRVAVTGIGIWSCIGYNIKEVEASLRTGRSGIGTDSDRLEYGYHCPLTGIVKRPALKTLLDRRTRAGMSEQAEYAFMAAKEAMEMAGFSSDAPTGMGCIFGNDTSAKPLIEAHEIMRTEHDSALIGAGNIFQTMNSTVTMNLSGIFRLTGASLTVSAACASSSHAIGIAAMMIRQGMQTAVLCGGAQEVNKYAVSSFDALDVFAQHSADPAKASRPFDAQRSGLVPSGGAAALVLEDYDHAVSRGARILCEVAGYGFSSNGGGGRLSTPGTDGIMAAMTHALSDAALTAADIDYINAHATGTPQGDAIEADAIAQMFSASRTWVSSTKSMTGHECWMAGAAEAVYSILMMQGGFIAPNINFETPDEHSAKLRIAAKATDAHLNTVLSNSFGFGGTNSTLILKGN